jgi:sulfate/thiosulfate transport system permease protein
MLLLSAKQMKKRLSQIPIPWTITIVYLLLVLILPSAALLTKSLTISFEEFWQIVTSKVAISTYEISFMTALVAAAINGVMGTLIAWVLVRYEFSGKKWVNALIDLPFALPTSVAGLVLATLYSEQGWIGKLLTPIGIKISFTRLGVLVAMIFISLPFIVRTLQPVLEEMERESEEAAQSLGASPWTTFRRVVLPPLIPAILTGVAQGFSRAVGEFGSVVIISSSIPFKDLVAPILIFQKLEQYDYDAATAIGTVLLLFSLFLLLVINSLQKWSRRYAIS